MTVASVTAVSIKSIRIEGLSSATHRWCYGSERAVEVEHRDPDRAPLVEAVRPRRAAHARLPRRSSPTVPHRHRRASSAGGRDGLRRRRRASTHRRIAHVRRARSARGPLRRGPPVAGRPQRGPGRVASAQLPAVRHRVLRRAASGRGRGPVQPPVHRSRAAPAARGLRDGDARRALAAPRRRTRGARWDARPEPDPHEHQGVLPADPPGPVHARARASRGSSHDGRPRGGRAVLREPPARRRRASTGGGPTRGHRDPPVHRWHHGCAKGRRPVASRARRERAAVALVEPDARGGARARGGRHAALPRVRPHRDHGRLGRDRQRDGAHPALRSRACAARDSQTPSPVVPRRPADLRRGRERARSRSIRSSLRGGIPIGVRAAPGRGADEVRAAGRRWSGARRLRTHGGGPGHPYDAATGLRKLGSIGVPIPDVDAKIVDLETRTRDLPIGETGELVVRGPNLMDGYYQRREETALALRDGWLYTGDVARMDEDGYFYIVDRKKELIIVSGYNVYPREVEEVLYAHPGVLEAAAIGVPDTQRGEVVKAFVVLRPGASATAEDLRTHCASSLARFKIPAEIEFRSDLPKSMVGKVLRRALAAEERAARVDRETAGRQR